MFTPYDTAQHLEAGQIDWSKVFALGAYVLAVLFLCIGLTWALYVGCERLLRAAKRKGREGQT